MNKTIMTVDDSASFRQLVAITLFTNGYEVKEAVNGPDALSKLDGNKIHMMFVDLNMPGMTGIELVHAVKSDPAYKFVPIIMLSSESEQNCKNAARTAGAAGWIVKPFKPEQLLAVVKKVLG